jgi:radial spoke head protein 9
MDQKELLSHLQYLKLNGYTLNIQERTALQSSLTLLRNDNHFHTVVYWGKILGVRNDYHIAQGYPGSILDKKITFYSNDGGISWNQLNPVDEKHLRYLTRIYGMFMGDPSYGYSFEKIYLEGEKEEEERLKKIEEEKREEEKKRKAEEEKKEKEGDEEEEENEEEEEEKEEEEEEEDDEEEKSKEPKPEIVIIPEEVRLSYVILCIDKDTSVVPRGAYILLPDNSVSKNDLFQGLTKLQAGKLKNYFHLRKPEILPNKTLLEREQLNKNIDFADSLDEDIPSRCWSLQYIDSYNLVIGKSLLWPGYVFYHRIQSNVYGAYYVGTGEKNNDLCFML